MNQRKVTLSCKLSYGPRAVTIYGICNFRLGFSPIDSSVGSRINYDSRINCINSAGESVPV